ncbi:hypothetical protein DL546_009882 [Coniochaeta pulveracea]|uniref:Telomeric single stranded DNA binding POT1/Cdc13 domain-containing protein n=1 Tax=Coniochaeta pulveracea TaxID=177199 RepID=A0A420YN95_9PEZI|nr:hypothetical protein DL546_009882 [Coniochaeta pulveracea]
MPTLTWKNGLLLRWEERDLLSDIPISIARFAGLAPSSYSHGTFTPSNSVQFAVWRSLPVERESLHTGITQQHGFHLSQPSNITTFLTTTSFSFISADGSQADDETTEHLTNQFYEQSLAIHEQIPSSQLLSQSDLDTQESTSFLDGTTTSFEDSTFYSQAENEEETDRPPLGNSNTRSPITDLVNIPAAAYILKAQPATITVNLIAGVISISTPRTIRTRWGGTSSLVEILIGDETKSGFAITFWLPPNCHEIEKSPLAGLRPQDIVLFQNVALNVFMTKVYGSSLRKGLTKVDLLHRRRLEKGDDGGYYTKTDLARATGKGHPQLEKTRRVWEWVLNFVGPGGGGGAQGRAKSGVRTWDMPPPDTQ